MSGSWFAIRAAPVDRSRRLAAAVPTWAWLTAIVAVSVAVRAVIGRGSPAPWIFDDELIYAGLAESFASSGTFAIRGVQGLLGYGPAYPLLISPAYVIFSDTADAYAAAKVINALLMSLAAIPVYLTARSVLGRWLSLAAATLALIVPSLAYTSVIMTENAFYPAFCLCVLAFVRMLERPTLGRQAAALGAIGLAYAVRAQAIALFPALVTTLLAYALLEARASADGLHARPLLRRLDAYRATWLALGAGAVLAVAAQAARGRAVGGLLGAYQDVTGWSYSEVAVARWFVYHLAELDLYLGVLPFAALLVVCAVACRPIAGSRQLRVFAAVAAPLVLWLALSASALSSQLEVVDGIGRIEERNLFYVVPLLLIALLVWVEQGLARYRVTTVAAAAIAGGLTAVIPYAKFMNLGGLSDTLAFVPLARSVVTDGLDAGDIRTLVVIGSVEAAIVFAFLPRRLALLAPLLVAAYLLVWQTSLNRQMQATSSEVLASAITVRPTWIDDAVGADAEVAALWSGAVNPLAIQENEFFNRSLDQVYAVGPAPLLGQQLAEPASTVSRNGDLLDGYGHPIRSPYVLADASTVVRGAPLARDRGTGLTVYRVGGPIRVRELFSGRYGDGWSGPVLTYTRYRCRPGLLLASVSPYPDLVRGRQTVIALEGGRPVAREVLPAGALRGSLVVPLRPRGGALCEITFTISPTASPAEALGFRDTRVLGVHFDELRYLRGGRIVGRP